MHKILIRSLILMFALNPLLAEAATAKPKPNKKPPKKAKDVPAVVDDENANNAEEGDDVAEATQKNAKASKDKKDKKPAKKPPKPPKK